MLLNQYTKQICKTLLNLTTRQDGRGQLGRDSNAKTARNSKIFQMDGQTNKPTYTARFKVACPKLKNVSNQIEFFGTPVLFVHWLKINEKLARTID